MTNRGNRWTTLLAGALVAFCLAAAPASGAGLLIADGGFGGVLEIEEQTVDVAINNGIAVTHVTQIFRNTENRQVEALYTFPVPKGASVANFSMWINGREMVGEVVEKERAREIYNSYKQVRRDPGLLEQTDYKTFEMRIFPIAPNAEQRVQITYYQELDFDSDWATYVYPLATATRKNLDSQTRGRFALNLEAVSEVPIVAMESPSHPGDFVFAQHDAHLAQASLETTAGDLNRDIVVAFQMKRPRTGFDVVASKERREDGFFLLTLTPGDERGDSDRGMDYVFILDVSGSMNDDGKLSLSRRSLGAFIQELGAEDRFEIVTFNVTAQNLFRVLESVDAASKAEASEFLGRQEARGGTFLEPAMRIAYEYKDPDRPLNVVILSDGMTEQRERQTLVRLIEERPQATRVFAIGVGNEVNRPLLEQLAEDSGGLAAFVSRDDNFQRQARAFRRKLMRPAATDVELEFEGGGTYDLEPQKLPSLYHGMPLRLYGRYQDGGPVTLLVRANLGGEILDRRLEIELPEAADNPEIERMWAWHRVQRLLKEADREGSRSPTVIDEIVELGEGFSIVTEYTSFLVLENDAEYRRWKIDRRNAARMQRDRGRQAKLRTRLDALRSAAPNGLGPIDDDTATPAQATTPRRSPASTGNQTSATSRGWDLDVGGGALDPVSAGIAAALAGLGLALRRRR
jgi:Ca-activated chloride channel family protein